MMDEASDSIAKNDNAEEALRDTNNDVEEAEPVGNSKGGNDVSKKKVWTPRNQAPPMIIISID